MAASAKECPEEGELVLCTVEKILGTEVFVKLDDYNKTGILVTSEVSPGRIYNIRDFVTPNKKIVCKVLRVDEAKEHIDLSLRRVSLKEKTEVLSRYKREKDASAILGRAIKEKARLEQIVAEIKAKYDLFEFLQAQKEKPELLAQFGFSPEEESSILKLVKERIKARVVKAKAKISVIGDIDDPAGVDTIKKALDVRDKRVKITYLSSPFYLVSAEAESYKEANKLLSEAIEEIEKRIEEAGGTFSALSREEK